MERGGHHIVSTRGARSAEKRSVGIGTVLVLIALALVWGTAGCSAGTGGDISAMSADSTTPTGQEDSEADPDTLVVAVSGMITPADGLKYYSGLSEYIGRKVGKPVRVVHKSDYTETNELLRDGKIDVAYVCSGPYVAGHDEFGLELVAAPVVNGRPEYYSYIIANRSSEATSLDSLAGKVFAFTDPKSNSGKLVPDYMLARAGTTAEKRFSETFYSYGHDNSIRAVAEGKADGAAVDSIIYDFAAATDPTFTSKTRIVTKSQPFAIPPVVVRPDLDPALKTKLRDAFLGAADDPEGQQFLKKMRIERFTEIPDSAYDSIREMNEWVESSRAK